MRELGGKKLVTRSSAYVKEGARISLHVGGIKREVDKTRKTSKKKERSNDKIDGIMRSFGIQNAHREEFKMLANQLVGSQSYNVVLQALPFVGPAIAAAMSTKEEYDAHGKRKATERIKELDRRDFTTYTYFKAARGVIQ